MCILALILLLFLSFIFLKCINYFFLESKVYVDADVSFLIIILFWHEIFKCQISNFLNIIILAMSAFRWPHSIFSLNEWW